MYRKVPAAGQKSAADALSVGDLLQTKERPTTPPGVERFHGPNFLPAGTRIKNYVATTDAPARPGGFSYGVRTQYGETAAGVMSQGNKNPLIQEVEDAHDEIEYKGPSTAPLGKSTVKARGRDLPSHVKEDEFRFGRTSDTSESAKNLLQPYDAGKEVNGDLYKRSHGSYAPGEQRQRNYTFSDDPARMTFGSKTKAYEGGVAASLQWTGEPGHTQPGATLLVPAHMEDRHSRTQPAAGIGRSAALERKGEIPDRSFGITSRADEVGVGGLMKGSYTEDQLAPDRDLGRCVKRGVTNQPRPGDEERIFGVPSIRRDIPPPKRQSLDDSRNYGTHHGARDLINPSVHHQRGIYSDDFLRPWAREDLRSIVQDAGIRVTPSQFDQIYDSAARFDPNGMVSVETFRRQLALTQQ